MIDKARLDHYAYLLSSARTARDTGAHFSWYNYDNAFEELLRVCRAYIAKDRKLIAHMASRLYAANTEAECYDHECAVDDARRLLAEIDDE